MGEGKPQKRAVAQAPLPERIGRYEVLLRIASGGMATVYLARAQGIGGFEREVALKLMHSHLQESAEFADDLVEEAKIAVRIHNAHVASVLDVGEDPLGIYLVMEYVEGETLSGLQRLAAATRERLPTRIGMRILVDALSGLHAAHEVKDGARPLGIVHRDFSPQNILVGLDGIGRLTDFGIAKATTRLSSTNTGIIKGKISYMSPEQARGQPVDRRCDVWAAGVLAWQLATGTKLYIADNELATLMAIATTDPPRARSVEPTIGRALDDVIAGALTLDLERRCPTASALRQGIIAAFRGSDGLAEHEEVAEYVATVAGSRLAQRRARVAELLDLRVRMGKLADVSGDRPPPTPLEVEAFVKHRESARHDATPEQPLDVATGTDQTAPDEATALVERAPTLTNTISVATTDTPHAVAPPGRPLDVRRLAAVASLTVVGLLTVVGGGVVFSGTSAHPTTPSVAVDAPPALRETLAATATTEPAVASAGAEKEPALVPARASIEIHSNAPLAAVRVNDRAVRVTRGATHVSADLTPSDTAEPLQVEATATDGRRASVALPAHASEARLMFTPSQPAPRPPATSTARSSSPFVSTSPYEKHP